MIEKNSPKGVRSYTSIIALFVILFSVSNHEAVAFGFEGKFKTPFKEICNSNNPPIALKSSVLSSTSAEIEWRSVNSPQEIEWDIEIIEANLSFTGNPTQIGILTNPFIITGLTKGTEYKFKVRAVCQNIPGNWSNSFSTFLTSFENGSICGTNIAIPDNGCNTPTAIPISVLNAPGDSLGKNVVLKELKLITDHSWPIDLEINLVSPSGDTVAIVNDNGQINQSFGNPNDVTCTTTINFLNTSNCGVRSIQDAQGTLSGDFLPLGHFSFFNNLSNPNGTWQLLICDDAADNVGSFKFAELVFKPVNCEAPQGLQLVEIVSPNSVLLNWGAGGNCSNTILEIGSPGFIPGTGDTVSADCPPFLLENLSIGSKYEVYISEKCGISSFSQTACNSLEFETPCNPPVISMQEDFDALQSCSGFFCTIECDINGSFWRNSRDERMDWTVLKGSTGSFGTGPSEDVSGNGKYIYMETSSHSFFGSCDKDSEAELKSNCALIDIKNSDTCHVQFSYHMFGQNVNSLSFEITTDGETWTSLWSKSGNQGDEWHEVKLSLKAFNNQIVQFRFIGKKGSDYLSDIGLDHIIFYGSQEVNQPEFKFYVDADTDGYGDEDRFTESCFNYIPPGFVTQSGDCNDGDSSVFPGAPEIPCNFIDENCNGVADDLILPAPEILSDSVNYCEGEQIELTATPTAGGEITWYDSDYNLLEFGNTLNVSGLSGVSNNPGTYEFLAEESFIFCFSNEPARIKLVIHPNPIIETNDEPTICENEFFDLSTVQISDQNNSPGLITYHSDLPATSANELNSSIVSPAITTSYFIKKTSTGDCFDVTDVTINVLPAPNAEIVGGSDTLFICKGNSSFLTGLESGGTGNLSILWNTFQNLNTIRVNSGTATGDENLFTFSVSDENNCSDSDSILIKTVSSVDTVEIVKTDATECNGNDGSIRLLPIDGTPDFNYSWSGPISGSASSTNEFTIVDLVQGSYSVTINDGSVEACPLILPNLVVNGPAARVELDTIRPTQCFGDSTGAIFLTVSGNNPTINWAPINSSQEDISNLPSGFYSVTVSDGDCQSVLENLKVEEPDSLFATLKGTDLTCFENNSGAIEIQVLGGIPPFKFNWNNAPPVGNPTNLSEGSYQLTVSDANNCSYSSDLIEINQPDALTVQVLDTTNPECYGIPTGKINISVNGGTPPYNYQWNDGSNDQNRSSLSEGMYEVTVSDVNGCSKILSAIEIEYPDEIFIKIDSIIDAKCIGTSDGSIFTTVTGGTGQLNYSWNDSPGGQNLIGVPTNNYVFEVTDSNRCIQNDTFNVNAPSVLSIVPILENPFCEGQSTGNIHIDSIKGGVAPFSFRWSDNSDNRDLIGVGNGVYEVTITDSNGCISEFSDLEIIGEQKLDDSNLVALSPVCHDEKTGKIFSNIVGGQFPLTYEWNNPSLSGRNLDNLDAGTYFLTVTDIRGCRLATDSINIINPDSLFTFDVNMELIKCFGDNSGSISVQAAGGVPPYDYSWNGGLFSGATLLNLPAGEYRLNVTDSLNCSVSHPVRILDQPQELTAETYLTTGINGGCRDTLNTSDTVHVEVSGGVIPYYFDWSNSSSDTMLTNIKPGEYAVTITDSNGCGQVLNNIKVPVNPLNFQFFSSYKKDVSCNGEKDGTIEMTFFGGRKPYQYLWSDGNGDLPGGTIPDNSIVFSDLDTGVYIVTIVDALGCTIYSDPIEISQPAGFSQTAVNSDSVSCFGGSDGFIEIEIEGGSEPYSFEWRRNSDTSIITRTKNLVNRPVGVYRCDVTDANGCTTFLNNLKILQPDTFTLQLIDLQNIKCREQDFGTINLKAFGGTPNFDFFWSTGGRDSFENNLKPGIHTVTVSDANRCILTDTFEISAPDSAFLFENSAITHIDCFDAENGTIQLDFSGGTHPYVFVMDNNQLSHDGYFENIAGGLHSFHIEDSNNCIWDSTFFFNEPEDIKLTETITDVSGVFSADGEIQIEVEGGTSPFSFLWDDGETSQNRTNLSPGIYFLVATDSAGCKKEGAYRIKVSSGIGELDIDGKISFAPNPTSGILTIQLDLNSNTILTGKVLSSTGKLIKDFQLNSSVQKDKVIDLSSHPSGVYFCTLQNDSGWKSWRIIKN